MAERKRSRSTLHQTVTPQRHPSVPLFRATATTHPRTMLALWGPSLRERAVSRPAMAGPGRGDLVLADSAPCFISRPRVPPTVCLYAANEPVMQTVSLPPPPGEHLYGRVGAVEDHLAVAQTDAAPAALPLSGPDAAATTRPLSCLDERLKAALVTPHSRGPTPRSGWRPLPARCRRCAYRGAGPPSADVGPRYACLHARLHHADAGPRCGRRGARLRRRRRGPRRSLAPSPTRAAALACPVADAGRCCSGVAPTTHPLVRPDAEADAVQPSPVADARRRRAGAALTSLLSSTLLLTRRSLTPP